jgi:hypothetical protein
MGRLDAANCRGVRNLHHVDTLGDLQGSRSIVGLALLGQPLCRRVFGQALRRCVNAHPETLEFPEHGLP